MWLHKVPILVLLVASEVQPLMWNTEVHKMSSSCGQWSLYRDKPLCSLTAITEPMDLDVGSIGAYKLPVDLDL